MESGLKITTCLALDHPPRIRRKSQKTTGHNREATISLCTSQERKDQRPKPRT